MLVSMLASGGWPRCGHGRAIEGVEGVVFTSAARLRLVAVAGSSAATGHQRGHSGQMTVGTTDDAGMRGQ